ncbi:hypothetical protein E2P81_ATG00507 [Venturia nashicola]|nr:hypothetical protein E2P81_ATG00507 [Venturia nashicola]
MPILTNGIALPNITMGRNTNNHNPHTPALPHTPTTQPPNLKRHNRQRGKTGHGLHDSDFAQLSGNLQMSGGLGAESSTAVSSEMVGSFTVVEGGVAGRRGGAGDVTMPRGRGIF